MAWSIFCCLVDCGPVACVCCCSGVGFLMMQISLFRIFLGSLAGFMVLILLAGGIVTAGVYQSNARASEREIKGLSQVSEIPTGVPALGQEALSVAMDIFAIDLPRNVKGPFYSPKLEDRGLTVKRGAISDAVVYIGPEAFSSWALLGSTLAHEIEIHGRQNFLAIHFQNLAGFDGTGMAEREAYGYELHQAERFGLNQYERELIHSTMSYFYPEKQNRLVQRFAPIKFWLDRLAANQLGKSLL
jgi:hypothetical protein